MITRFVWLAALVAMGACARRASLRDPGAAAYTRTAPDSFDVRMETTRGTMDVRLRRHWSPLGVDRFHALVQQRYFDDVGFHRVIRNYVAQFGIHGDTAVTRAWRGRSIPDEPVLAPNRKGTISYARGGANSRSVQLFFNTVDNTPRLDTLNSFGFPPIGEVVAGMAVLDSLNWEYSGTRGGQSFPGPSQDSLSRVGNAYLRRSFPRLDYIVRARVVKRW
ncbi:MAG: peptidylprolyl isomerase [Gemmatimonadetes bacterium]|nr:peptidylprolyl isomerase [Gemmatimonadota bacterium]